MPVLLLAFAAVLLRQGWNKDIWGPLAELNLEILQSEAKPPPPSRPSRQQQLRLTREQRANVVSDYRAGLSLGAVARKHGVHINTVQRHVTKAGLEIRLQTPGIPDDELRNAKSLRDAGWSYQAIGDNYGCSHTAVGNALKRFAKRSS